MTFRNSARVTKRFANGVMKLPSKQSCQFRAFSMGMPSALQSSSSSAFQLRAKQLSNTQFQKRSLYTVELTEENIEQEFLNSSKAVILKFEANWCGPCQMLSPMLKQSLETYADDKVVLATLNVDTPLGQTLSQKFNVTSIPLVVAFKNRTVLAHFGGVLAQEDLDKWTQDLVKEIESVQDAEITEKDSGAEGEEKAWLPADALKNGKELFDAGDYDGAMNMFGKVVSDPSAEAFHAIALVGMARVSLKVGKIDDAKTCVDNIPSSAFDNEEVKAIAALVKLVQEAGGIEKSIDELKKITEEDKSDLNAFYQLALQYAAREMYEESVNSALHIVKKDKTWEQGKAKEFLLSLFSALGPNHAVAKKGRARLANALY